VLPDGSRGLARTPDPPPLFSLRCCRVLQYNRRMQINLPNDADVIVFQKAEAAGFGEDVNAYVAYLISEDDPIEEPHETLSEAELGASLKMIRESEADIASGRTQDMREGLQEIAEKHGLTISQ